MSRNFIGAVVIATITASLGFAQGRSGVRTFGSPHGFGNILYPGTGNAPRLPAMGPSFAQQLGATVAGRPFPGIRPNPSGLPNHRQPIYMPLAYPVYVGGYGYPYQQQYPQQPVVVVQAPPQPPVIINNHYFPETANPVMRQYKEGDVPPSSGMRTYEAPGPAASGRSTIVEDKATIYLIVYQDESVHPSIAYWVKEGTLHYITLQGTHNRVSLDLVDVPESEKLNRDRKVEFSLANPK